MLLFEERQFQPYWFETGTPTFLVDLLTERQTWLPQLGQLETSAEFISTFDVDDLPIEALIFQTGYLTIAATAAEVRRVLVPATLPEPRGLPEPRQ